jgi:hypothetical protein
MSERLVSWLLRAAIFLLFFGIGFMSSRSCRPDTPQQREVVRVDTLTVFDTIVKNKPIYITKVVERVDTVRLVTVKRDTVAAVIPIERKVYAEDSLYRAVVTGYLASLDSLVIWPKTTTITIDRTVREPAPRWSFGVTAGPAVLVSSSGRMHVGAGIAVGVSCRF